MSAEPVRILPPHIDWAQSVTPEAIAYAKAKDPTPICPTCGQPVTQDEV